MVAVDFTMEVSMEVEVVSMEAMSNIFMVVTKGSIVGMKDFMVDFIVGSMATITFITDTFSMVTGGTMV